MRNSFKLINLLSKANIPYQYRYATFNNYLVDDTNQKQVQDAKAFCQDRPDYGLTIIGKVGTGKTRLSISILRNFIEQGVEGLFYRVPRLLRTIKNSFNQSEDSPNLVDRCCEVPLLVIDDLGCCRHSAWVDEVLDDIISERCSEGLPTIVTSNLSQKELERYLTARLYSRLVKGGELIPIVGEDKRPKRIKCLPSPEEAALWQAVDKLNKKSDCTNRTEEYEDFIRIYGFSLDKAIEKKPTWEAFSGYYLDCQNQDIEVVRRAYREYCGLSDQDEEGQRKGQGDGEGRADKGGQKDQKDKGQSRQTNKDCLKEVKTLEGGQNA